MEAGITEWLGYGVDETGLEFARDKKDLFL
jgi:hypothetical protein